MEVFLLVYPRDISSTISSSSSSSFSLLPSSFPSFRSLSLSLFILLSLPIPLFFSLASSLDTGLSRIFAWYIESLSRYISVYMYTLALYRLIFRFTYYEICIVLGYSFRTTFSRGMILVIGLLFLLKGCLKGGYQATSRNITTQHFKLHTQQRKKAQTK